MTCVHSSGSAILSAARRAPTHTMIESVILAQIGKRLKLPLPRAIGLAPTNSHSLAIARSPDGDVTVPIVPFVSSAPHSTPNTTRDSHVILL